MSQPILVRQMSAKMFIGHYLAAVGVGIVIAGLTAVAFPTHWFLYLLAPLPLLAALGHARLSRAGTAYRLFPDRLEVESGLFSRSIENVELFRIRDVGLRQGVLGKLANFGDVYVHSTDSSTPDLHVRGIDAPQEFYQQLRDLSASNRAQSRTMIVEEGQTLPEP